MIGPYELDTITTGDSRKLAMDIPDNSIDLILCDPVYNQLWQYAWLAECAGRVLKPGGSVIAQTGLVYRFEAEVAFDDPRLERRPLLTELYSGGFKSVWKHRILKAGHPWIWSEKGKPSERRGWPRSAFFGLKDKSRHKWGDGERGYAFILSRMAKPGDIVLDPFCGSGTCPAACLSLGCHFIAFEIDPDTAERARRRVAETQRPLFTQEFEQNELFKSDHA